MVRPAQKQGVPGTETWCAWHRSKVHGTEARCMAQKHGVPGTEARCLAQKHGVPGTLEQKHGVRGTEARCAWQVGVSASSVRTHGERLGLHLGARQRCG